MCIRDRSRDKFNKEDFYEKLKEKDIKFVTVEDEDYPENLKPYDHRPYYLFYKGKLPDCNKPIVAMVGARACSGYGRNMAKKLAEDLSKAGVQIISGMARGIDTYSQLGAIVGETATFSVVGTGVDVCYPTENIELYNDILKKGGIISEYPPGSKALAWHFPQRNRIISGLSDKVVVVEAKEKSGSLITVEWALEQGRDVMAVPDVYKRQVQAYVYNTKSIKAGQYTFNTSQNAEELFNKIKEGPEKTKSTKSTKTKAKSKSDK